MKHSVLAVMCTSGLLSVPARSQADQPACRAGPVLDGEAQLRLRLARLLVRRGIQPALRPSARCPGPRVTIEPDRGGLAVTLLQPGDRREQRVVADEEIAATWLESRLSRDLDAPLLAADTMPAPASTDHPATPRPARARRVPLVDGFSLAASYQTGLLGASTWRGLDVEGCLRVAWLCAGLAIQGRRAERGAGGTATVPELAVERTDLTILAAARARLPLGRATVAPRLGIGPGRLWTRTPAGAYPAASSDPDRPAGFWPDQEQTAVGLRLDGQLALQLPLSAHLSLELGVGTTVAPAARAAAALPSGTAGTPEAPSTGPVPADGRGSEPVPQTDTAQPALPPLPADPRWMLRAGLGLRLELP